MSDPPALDAVLVFLSCSCTCACVNPTCVYIVNGLRCSDICRLGMREENDKKKKTIMIVRKSKIVKEKVTLIDCISAITFC